jgi:hypothetical protein
MSVFFGVFPFAGGSGGSEPGGEVGWADVTGKPSVYPAAPHDHDAAYAGLGHNHDSAYAGMGHNHDAAYPPLNHVHAEQFLHVVDEKASNTAGGTFTSGDWRTRDLNTTRTNGISGASLASNQVTLPAGTYYVEGLAAGYMVGGHKARLYNVTDAAEVKLGLTNIAGTSVAMLSMAQVAGRFTISAQKTFELQHRCETTKTTYGFGNGNGFSGVPEVYAELRIWKVN